VKTVLDLLNPPCPEDALGEELVGFDLDSPLIPELEALFERFGRNTDLPDMFEQAPEYDALEDQWIELRQRALGPVRSIDSLQVSAATLLAWFQQSAQWTNLARSDFHWALGLWEKKGEGGTLYITDLTGPNAGDTRMESFGNTNRIPTFRFVDPNEPIAETTMDDSPEDTEGELVELSQPRENVARRQREELERVGYLGLFDKTWSPCPAGEVLQNTLAASDAMLAIWEVRDPPTRESLALPYSKEHHLATPGALLGARIMEEGELLEDNDNCGKYYRNESLQVRGNSWARFRYPRLSAAQKGYIITFFDPYEDRWPSTPEPKRLQPKTQSASQKLEPLHESEPLPKLEPLPVENHHARWLWYMKRIRGSLDSSTGWATQDSYLEANLHEAAQKAGWTEQDAANRPLFLEALKAESLAGCFALYPGNWLMPDEYRWAVAPSDEAIIEALRKMLSVWKASDTSPLVFPTDEELLTEARRLRQSIRVLPPVQPVWKQYIGYGSEPG